MAFAGLSMLFSVEPKKRLGDFFNYREEYAALIRSFIAPPGRA